MYIYIYVYVYLFCSVMLYFILSYHIVFDYVAILPVLATLFMF